jgi:SET domain-containing protein
MALIVKRSRLPGAGKGLFTDKPIKKGKRIIQYRGETINRAEFAKRLKANKFHYAFLISRNKYIDAYNTLQYKARYANDANGTGMLKGVKNNCIYELDEHDRIFILATSDIKKGEEILVDYCKPYWTLVRKRQA